MATPPPLTELLRRARAGDVAVRTELEGVLYRELLVLARSHMAQQRAGQTLQSTALVHEAWLKLEDPLDRDWESRQQFFALASRVMRSILVDHARARRSEKRGGGALRVTMEAGWLGSESTDLDLVDLDDALSALHALDQELGRLIELRLFGGLTNNEIASHLGQPLRSVERSMQVAKLWLKDQLTPDARGA